MDSWMKEDSKKTRLEAALSGARAGDRKGNPEISFSPGAPEDFALALSGERHFRTAKRRKSDASKIKRDGSRLKTISSITLCYIAFFISFPTPQTASIYHTTLPHSKRLKIV